MRKELQIFTQLNAQNVPVDVGTLDTLDQEVLSESIFREYIRELLKEEDSGEVTVTQGAPSSSGSNSGSSGGFWSSLFDDDESKADEERLDEDDIDEAGIGGLDACAEEQRAHG